MASEVFEVEISRLGSGGDGVAELAGAPVYVPFTLPGERAVITPEPGSDRGSLLDVVAPSPDRVAPVCPYFGACGGCALQHMERGAYLAWKAEQVAAALKARGLSVEIEPARPVPLGSRRRAALALGRDKDGAVLGYRRARSHDLIDVSTCPVLIPSISNRLAKLKQALAPLLGGKREARVTVTETESGLDVLVAGARPNPAAIGTFAAQAGVLGVARLTADGESIALGGTPEVDLSGAKVKLPPGAFLQASREAEADLVKLMLEGTEGAKRVADLFAGLGTFSLALARTSAVDAYEADDAALASLAEAARRTPKLKPVKTFVRDLFHAPLGTKELDPYDAVVFDPPRAGAVAQAEALAKSRVPRLVAVSCNPGTLARDLRILVDGGYRITRVVPVDQFLFSPHIEVVAHLVR
ncbi:MAG: class I SAM-dependent RNA methyltransferase [Methyloceanibacter sp.]